MRGRVKREKKHRGEEVVMEGCSGKRIKERFRYFIHCERWRACMEAQCSQETKRKFNDKILNKELVAVFS